MLRETRSRRGDRLNVTRSTTALSDVRDTVRGIDRSRMGGVTLAPSPICLITGDEELLVARAVDATVSAARARDNAVELRELDAGGATPADFVELVSPSLFGGGRIVLLRNGQDARKELVETEAALLKAQRALEAAKETAAATPRPSPTPKKTARPAATR